MGHVGIALILTLFVSQMIASYAPAFALLRILCWIILFPITLHLLSRYSSNRKRGVVTTTGIIRHNQDTEITFDAIKSITGGQGLQNIFTANTSIEIYLPKQEIIKLSKTVLNNWMINNYTINIFPTTSCESLTITYLPVGKYTFDLNTMFYILLAIGIFFVRSDYWIITFFLGAGIYFCLQKYPSITVKIHDDGISIIEKNNESFISFADIQKVKKNMLYIKIHTKNKRSFILPKQCLYLYEFLESKEGVHLC